MCPPAPLSSRERALLAALETAAPKVLTRSELARRAGLGALSPRRVDSLLMNVRLVVGPGRLRNVRGRGWAIS